MSDKRARKQERRARKRKVQRARQPSDQQLLLKRAQKSDYLKDAQILVHSGDIEKMSDVILRFAEPVLRGPGGPNTNAIRLAIAVWNVSLLPKDAQSEALTPILNMLPEGDQDLRYELLAAIEMLLARKQRYFAHNTRVILDYQITDSADTLHLDVISTVAKGYRPPQ
ncbi:MAG: hypothetical protein HYZ72_16515 [Deltaproteobacteria bacterium]|nr:hypothetical protein [Deltaproteobacteria bacterium]